MTDLMHKQLLTSAIEFIVIRVLAFDKNALIKLSQIDGYALTLNIKELGFPLCFSVAQQKVLVTSRVDEQCIVSANLSVLSTLKDAAQLTELLKTERLALSGDIHIAQQFAQLAKALNIDWRSEIALQIGDIATHKLGLLFTQMKQKAAFLKQQVSEDSTEWLLHEAKVAAHRLQVQEFNQHVTHMSQQTDKLEQRINRLLH